MDDILKEYNLTQYDEIELLKATKGKVFTDNFELEYIG